MADQHQAEIEQKVERAVLDLAAYWRGVAEGRDRTDWDDGFAQAMRENADDLEARFQADGLASPSKERADDDRV